MAAAHLKGHAHIRIVFPLAHAQDLCAAIGGMGGALQAFETLKHGRSAERVDEQKGSVWVWGHLRLSAAAAA